MADGEPSSQHLNFALVTGIDVDVHIPQLDVASDRCPSLTANPGQSDLRGHHSPLQPARPWTRGSVPTQQVILATALARRIGEEERQPQTFQNQGAEEERLYLEFEPSRSSMEPLLQLQVLSGIAGGPDRWHVTGQVLRSP